MLKRLAPRRSKKNKEENSQDLTTIRHEPISNYALLDTDDSELNCYEQTPVQEFRFNEADDYSSNNQETTTRTSRGRRGRNGLTTIENGFSNSSSSSSSGRNKDDSRDSAVVVGGKNSSQTRISRSHTGASLNPSGTHPAVDKNTATGEQHQPHHQRRSSPSGQPRQRPLAAATRDVFCAMENRKSTADAADVDGSSWVSQENARNEAAVRSSLTGNAADDATSPAVQMPLPMRPSLEEMFCVTTTPSRSASGGPTKSTGSGSDRVNVLRQTASADSFKKQMREVINSTNGQVRKVHRRLTRNKVSGSYGEGPIYPRQTPGPPAQQDPYQPEGVDCSAVDRAGSVDDEPLLIEETPVFAFVDNSN